MSPHIAYAAYAISLKITTRATLNAEIPSAAYIDNHPKCWDCETV